MDKKTHALVTTRQDRVYGTLTLPPEAWRKTGHDVGGHPRDRLSAVIDFAGHTFHAEAWRVEEGEHGQDSIVLQKEYGELCSIFAPNETFGFIEIGGYAYVLFITGPGGF